MTPSGWIKLWRKAAENPYLQQADTLGIFCRLLQTAQWQDSDVYCHKTGTVISLKRGDCWVSTVDLAQMVSSRKRLRTILKHLEKGQLIGQATGQGITIITICNYDRYQGDDEAGARVGAKEGPGMGQGGASQGPGWGQQNKEGQEREEGKERKERKEQKNLFPPKPPSDGSGERPQSKAERFQKFQKLQRSGSGRIYPAEFENFWACFPTRPTDTKKSAYESWRKIAAVPEIGPQILQDGVERYAVFIASSDHEPKLVATWINGEGWTANLQPQANQLGKNNGRRYGLPSADEMARDLAQKLARDGKFDEPYGMASGGDGFGEGFEPDRAHRSSSGNPGDGGTIIEIPAQRRAS